MYVRRCPLPLSTPTTSFNITFRLLNGDMVFSRKTKVSCYKSEINKSVMLHAFFKKKTKGIVLQCLTKTQKYPVTNISIVCKKASNKISANRISHFVTF